MDIANVNDFKIHQCKIDGLIEDMAAKVQEARSLPQIRQMNLASYITWLRKKLDNEGTLAHQHPHEWADYDAGFIVCCKLIIHLTAMITGADNAQEKWTRKLEVDVDLQTKVQRLQKYLV